MSTFVFKEEDHIDANVLIDTSEIKKEEIKTALQHLKNSKALGEDQIVAELLKYGDETMRELTKLFNLEERKCIKAWTRGMIVKLPKKGNLRDCNNRRGTTLLSIPDKVFCSVLLRRMQTEFDKIFRIEQAAFRKGRRPCIEQSFTLRNTGWGKKKQSPSVFAIFCSKLKILHRYF